ncbi:hypothetical protein [Microcoleus sp. herbarium2]|uniref:hypothetical protein n=1 Tax=Microcoleus sp. herbarium2 TaxID=3055433 RepID=UPI002FD0A898
MISPLMQFNEGVDRAPRLHSTILYSRARDSRTLKIPFLRAHQLETKRQQAFKTVLAAEPSPASAVAPTRSAAAESVTSNVE